MKTHFRKVSLVSLLEVIQGTTEHWETHIAPIQDTPSTPEMLMKLLFVTCC